MSENPPTSPVEELGRLLAEKRGLDPKEAALWVAIARQREGITFMDEVTKNAPVLQKLHPSVQRDVLGQYAMASLQPKDNFKDLKDLAMQMTVLREAMRGGTETQKPATDPAVNEELKKLTDTINKMKEEENTRRLAELDKSWSEKLDKMGADIQSKIAGITPGAAVDTKLPITQAVEQLQELEKAKGSMRELLGVKEGGGEVNISTALEQAKKLGYTITGPKTIDEMQKELTEQVEKMRKETIEETTKKLASDDKKLTMIVDIGTAVLESVLPAITQGGPGAVSGLETAKAALKAATAEGT